VANDIRYIDAVTRIDLVNGVVRAELGVLQPPRGEGKQPEVAQSGVLIMSIEGFVRVAATMQQFLEQLAAKGVLRREPAGTPARGPDKPPGKSAGSKSSNVT
jgi:hypothetical protein